MKLAIMVIAKKKPQSGMSLVELMVAMVIGLFLTAGVFTMFSMSSSNITTTSQFNQLQENGRIALAIMERDISQLAFMGDMTGTDFILGVNTTLETAVVDDCVGDGLNNATLPNNQPAHFRRLWGYENKTNGAVSLSCLPTASVNENTDVFQMKRFIGPSLLTGLASGFNVATNTSQVVFFKGAAPTTVTLENARTWEYQHHVYFIANDADGIPVLRRKTLTDTGMRGEEQLVEGIENIRFLYGFDNDGDSTPDSFLPASDVTSLMWDNESFQRLVAIKVFVLVRSIQKDESFINDAIYQLGDKAKVNKTQLGPFNDHFRRKVMSTTIVLENPVLIRS